GHLALLAAALGEDRGLPVSLVVHGQRSGRTLAGGRRLEAVRAELEGETEELLDELRPQVVLNAIALPSLAACEEEPDAARALNVDFPERIAGWTDRNNARFVHVSTDLVFGGRPPRSIGYTEDDPAEPLSVYGASKLRGERRVLEANPLAVVCRLPLLFGPSAPNSFGEKGTRPRGASETVLDAARAGRELRLFRDEFRTPLDVESAAHALLELADRGTRGLLHLAGPTRMSRVALGEAVLRSAGWTAEATAQAITVTTRAEAGEDFARIRPADVSLDASRARALLDEDLPDPFEALADRVDGQG
ncbi:MAG: sugar nucleotide-binding protein, partial [Planctomycetota bacterium]